MISWKEEYRTGIPLVDEQHKKLFEIADDIFLLIKDSVAVDKYDRILKLLEELKDYTIYHFDSEEKYMQTIAYKNYFSHKKEHAQFIEKIEGIDLTKLDENQNAYLLDIMDYVVTWIGTHILEKDKMIVANK